jgi:hypothetical protein
MSEKEALASQNAKKDAATNLASEEQIIVGTPTEVEDCGCDEDSDRLPITKKAIINGQEQEIVIAFTACNVTVSNKKADLSKYADEVNLLPVKYNFAKAELFWKEKVELKDLNEEVIEEGTPNVYVLCPEPGTNCRIYSDDVLTDVEVHDFKSVQDWATKVGTTNVFCQGFDKVKEVAVAALATGDEAAKQVARFALEFGVSKSAAEDYLLARLTPKNISLMMMGHKPKVEISLGRTWDDAVRLLHGISNTFGENNRGKCFTIRSINAVLDGDDFDLEAVLKALQTVPAQKMVYSGLKKCGEKENCIVKALTSWIVKMQLSELRQAS